MRQRNDGGGAATLNPRPVSTADLHFSQGTVSLLGPAPERRELPIIEPRPEDRERFDLAGKRLQQLRVPPPCRDGGPVDSDARDTVVAYNSEMKFVGYPLHEPDRDFDRWRDRRDEAERHEANNLATIRWAIRASAVAPTDELEGIQRVRSAAEANLIGIQRIDQVSKAVARPGRSKGGKGGEGKFKKDHRELIFRIVEDLPDACRHELDIAVQFVRDELSGADWDERYLDVDEHPRRLKIKDIHVGMQQEITFTYEGAPDVVLNDHALREAVRYSIGLLSKKK